MKISLITFNLAVLLQLIVYNSNSESYPAEVAKKNNIVVNHLEFPVAASGIDTPFLMPVDSMFLITGRGTVATGRIERGAIQTGDPIEIIGLQNRTISSVVTAVEISFKNAGKGMTGDSVGLLLRGVELHDIRRGMVICAPRSVAVHTQFILKAYILSEEEGGRQTAFFNRYKPQFLILTADVTGEVELPTGTEMVKPGDSVNMTVTLSSPVALEKNFRIIIREGGKTIGSGVVTEVLR